MRSRFSTPHTSEPYTCNKTGTTTLSKRSNWHSSGKLISLIFLNLYRTWLFVPDHKDVFFVLQKEPVREKTTPRYLKSLTLSITWLL